MPTIPTPTEHIDDDIEREILSDPEAKKALAELEDPEDREDLIDALIVLKGIAEGKIKTPTLKELQKARSRHLPLKKLKKNSGSNAPDNYIGSSPQRFEELTANLPKPHSEQDRIIYGIDDPKEEITVVRVRPRREA